MFRISIAGILWLTALAAVNFAVLRYFEHLSKFDDPIILLVGLMPLFDGFLISLYAAATRRYDFALKRRESRGSFAEAFALTAAMMLAVSTFLCITAPQAVLELLEDPYNSSLGWLPGFAQQPNGVSLAVVLCLIISGPLLVIAAVFAFVMSRYKVVVARKRLEHE
jgi:hypothetical protein